jgi:hypothetical protein
MLVRDDDSYHGVTGVPPVQPGGDARRSTRDIGWTAFWENT